MFFQGSRYEFVGTDLMVDNTGREIRFKKIRFIPVTEALMRHGVVQGERLDQIAHRYYRDAELFWRIADANRVLRSTDLVATPGRRIAIPAAQD
jgi:nucleoid-associated protein YgaU